MDVNIEIDAVTSQLSRLVGHIERIESKISNLQVAVHSAASGIQSENYDKASEVVNRCVTVMNGMVNELQDAKRFIADLLTLAEKYLSLKY